MQYTSQEDWVTGHTESWSEHLDHLKDKHEIHGLEIGVWEGRSAIWFLTNLAYTHLTLVDHFDGFRTEEGRERYKTVLKNVATGGFVDRTEIVSKFSAEALLQLRMEERMFDFAYIDGSHHRLDAMEDALGAWRCLKPGGVIILDDFSWPDEQFDSMKHPRSAIEGFEALVAPEATTVHKDYQLIMRKHDDARPFHGVLKHDVTRVPVVFIADSAYEAPLTVAVLSVLKSWTKPHSDLTVCIIDLGLEHPCELENMVVNYGATFARFEASRDLFPSGMSTWAKLWLDELVPYERILYLDADVLVRSDVREILALGRETLLAAVSDFGIAGNFNAGA
jgi:predicted O-methyltransferase YrrM